MKNNKLKIIAVIFLIMLSSVVLAAKNSVPKNKKKCLKAGGAWQSWTKMDAVHHNESCRIKAHDAGKACLDGRDCSTKVCEYDPSTKMAVCPEYAGHEGCHSWMKNGVPETAICVD